MLTTFLKTVRIVSDAVVIVLELGVVLGMLGSWIDWWLLELGWFWVLFDASPSVGWQGVLDNLVGVRATVVGFLPVVRSIGTS